MTAKEKEYFEFCGTRRYYATLAIVLLVGSICLCMSLPFMISANICYDDPKAIEQQDIDETYKRYIQEEEGMRKRYAELNIISRFLLGVIAFSFVASVVVTDVIRCRRIRRRLKKAREEKRKREEEA